MDKHRNFVWFINFKETLKKKNSYEKSAIIEVLNNNHQVLILNVFLIQFLN